MRLQRRRFSEPADVRRFPHGQVDVVELDDVVVGRMTYQPGWRWSVDVKPIAGTEQCQYHHLGVTLDGRLRVQMPDGPELEIGPGDVFEIPPGHDAWVVGDSPWVSVDFEAMRSYGRTAEERAERSLVTILFTDIVESTAAAARLGDQRPSRGARDPHPDRRSRSVGAGSSSVGVEGEPDPESGALPLGHSSVDEPDSCSRPARAGSSHVRFSGESGAPSRQLWLLCW